MSKHIIGKVYDVTAANINKLCAELDELKVENNKLKKALLKADTLICNQTHDWVDFKKEEGIEW